MRTDGFQLTLEARHSRPFEFSEMSKVERTQRTDWEEFYSLVDLKASDLPEQLQQWQTYYNRERRHSSIGTSPWQKFQDKLSLIPSQEQVSNIYQASTERLRFADYRRDIGKPKWIWSL